MLFVFSNYFSIFFCGKKVGYLVPLDKNLEEDNSGLKIPLSEGPNIIGRSNVLVSDKRISRKHITLTISTDGPAKLLVVACDFPHLLPKFCSCNLIWVCMWSNRVKIFLSNCRKVRIQLLLILVMVERNLAIVEVW